MDGYFAESPNVLSLWVGIRGSFKPMGVWAGYLPVMNATRVGVQTGAAAYACMNLIPSVASLSIFGVDIFLLP